MSNPSIVEVTASVVWVNYKRQHEMTRAFLRPQEFEDSIAYRGVVFDLEEFKGWYEERHGEFTYYDEVAGVNVRAAAFLPFFGGLFDPLSEDEKQLLDLLQPYRGTHYVIGTYNNDECVLRHEMAHALFNTEMGYALEIMKLLQEQGFRLKRMFRYLERNDYHPATWLDEVQAAVVDDGGYPYWIGRLAWRQKMHKLFYSYCPLKFKK